MFCAVYTLEILTEPDLIKCKRNLVARYSGTAWQCANISKRQENENKTSGLPEEIRTQELGWALFVQ